MQIPNEILFLIITLASLGIVLLSAILGRYWLHAVIVVFIVFVTFTAGKLITVFGFTASIATPIYAGIFLATDALYKCYGERDARVAVWKGFFAMLCVTFLGQLIQSSAPLENDLVGHGLEPILTFIPSLFFGSALAYIISQHIDITILNYLNVKFKQKKIWISNNVSTIISQFVDSVIVYTIAFFSTANLVEIIMVAWLMKILVALIDTPFLYAILNYAERHKTREAKENG